MPLKLTMPLREKPKPTCVMLINDIARLFHEQMRKSTEEHHFKTTYRLILRAVARQGGMSQLQIAQEIHLAPPTVSITLQKMEKEGLVRREVDPKDLRQVLVRLTDKGREIDHILRKTAEEIDQSIMKDITPQEIEVLYPILKKMYRNISADREHE